MTVFKAINNQKFKYFIERIINILLFTTLA